MGLENLYMDTSDTTVTFPHCPDVATEFFQPQRTSTKKPESIDEKLQAHIDQYDEYMQRAGETIYGRGKEERSCQIPPDKGINDKIQYHIDRYEDYLRKLEEGVTLVGQKEEKEDGKGTGRKRPAEQEASGAPAAKTAAVPENGDEPHERGSGKVGRHGPGADGLGQTTIYADGGPGKCGDRVLCVLCYHPVPGGFYAL